MKIYIAAPYPARARVADIGLWLGSEGHECTSGWAYQEQHEIATGTVGASLDTKHEDVEEFAKRDLADIFRADALLSLTANWCIARGAAEDNPDFRWLHAGGRHVEVGYALALGRPVVIVGEPENIFQRSLCIPAVSLKDALEQLETRHTERNAS